MTPGSISADEVAVSIAAHGGPLLYTTKEAAARLGVHPDTLKKWRDLGLIQPRKPLKGEQTMFYTLPDLLRFIEGMGKG